MFDLCKYLLTAFVL